MCLQDRLKACLLRIEKRLARQKAEPIVVLPVHLDVDLLKAPLRNLQKRLKRPLLSALHHRVEPVESPRQPHIHRQRARALLTRVPHKILLPPRAEGSKVRRKAA